MSSKGTLVQILGCLSLLLMSTPQATAGRVTIFDLILEELKNIEDLIKQSSQQTLYLTSSARPNGIIKLPHRQGSADLMINVDHYEGEEIIHRHTQNPKIINWHPRTSNSENDDTNANDNEVRVQTEDDTTADQHSPKRHELISKQRINVERPVVVIGSGNDQIGRGVRYSTDWQVRPKVEREYVYGIGSRSSRSRNRNRNVNRNVNSNVNNNVNSNSNRLRD